MSPLPDFSVVIPAYNVETVILRALESVGDQHDASYEVIVADDASTDRTVHVVSQWAKANPSVNLTLLNGRHRRIGATRNLALAGARAPFVAFLDADDYWLPGKLASVAAKIRQHPSCDIVCHDEWVERNGLRVGRLDCGPFTAYHDLFFGHNCLSTSATVVRRSRLASVGGFSEDPNLDGVEDYDLWLRLFRIGCAPAYINEVFGVYTLSPEGVSNRIAEHCDHALRLLDAAFSEFPRPSLRDRRRIRARRASNLRSAAFQSMKRGDVKNGLRFAFRTVLEHPFAWAMPSFGSARPVGKHQRNG